MLVLALLSNTTRAGDQVMACQSAKLTASDPGISDRFGYSVAIFNDFAIVGANLDDNPSGISSGSAYVFRNDGTGNWHQTAKLIASDGVAYDRFGSSVALSGETAIVGALPLEPSGTGFGSAYIFRSVDRSTWIQLAKLVPLDAAFQDHFGLAVCIFGDTAIVGAPRDDDMGTDSGSAYVFRDDGSGNWRQVDKLLASDGAQDDQFGWAVSVFGRTAVVGARIDDDQGLDSGSAYIFHEDESRRWHQADKLIVSDGAPGDQFGWSIAILDDTMVVGAWNDDDQGTDSGSAYIFREDGSGRWCQLDKLIAADGRDEDAFGISVAFADDTAIVGALRNDAPGRDSGSAYVFRDDGRGHWRQTDMVTASDAGEGDTFGSSVAVSGNIAIVGAPFDPLGTYFGSAYAFKVAVVIGDFDCDDDVDIFDLVQVLVDWGPCPNTGASCPTDLDGNGIVNGHDLALLLAAWG